MNIFKTWKIYIREQEEKMKKKERERERGESVLRPETNETTTT